MVNRFDVYQGDGVTTLRPRTATTRPLYYVLRDWECSRWAGGVRDMGFTKEGEIRHAVPCVFRLGDLEYIDGHYTYLNKEWQFFTFDLMCLMYYGKVHGALSDLEYNWIANRWANVYHGTTAFTNRQGTNTNRDYVNDRNMDASKGIGIYTLVCGGASLESLGVFTNKTGGRMVQVNTFDGTKPPPDVTKLDIRTDPRIFYATIISDKRINSGYRTYRFSQLQNPTSGRVYDLPIPIVTSKPSFYPMADLRYVADGIKPSPYHP